MNGHVKHQLNQYYDGELTPGQAASVASHVAVCDECHEALRKMQALSTMLQQIPVPSLSTSPERFASRIALQLPQRVEPRAQQILKSGWRLMPFALASIWGFVQAVFLVAFFVQILLGLGLLPGLSAHFPQSANSWVSIISTASGATLADIGEIALKIVTFGDDAVQTTIIYVLLQSIIGILLCSWLASWWSVKQHSALRSQ